MPGLVGIKKNLLMFICFVVRTTYRRPCKILLWKSRVVPVLGSQLTKGALKLFVCIFELQVVECIWLHPVLSSYPSYACSLRSLIIKLHKLLAYEGNEDKIGLIVNVEGYIYARVHNISIDIYYELLIYVP